MREKFYREVAALELVQSRSEEVLTEADLASLPPVVKRYFHFMGAVGRPRIWSLHIGFDGRFKRARDAGWLPCETIQYNSADELARLFYMTLRFWFIPMLGRDTYVRGKGRMLGRLLDLVTVVDGKGPEFDISELVTYLNDAIMMAPSMLLRPEIAWASVDDHTFDVSLTERGMTVEARVSLDDQGAPVNFSTTDRFMADLAGQNVRTRWTTPIEAWTEIDGRRVVAAGKAVWHPEGEEPLVYIEFRLLPESVAFNLPPGVAPARN